MELSPEERADLLQTYAEGPALFEAAFAAVPEVARTWRPAPGEWSAHEIVLHCADSETASASRIRFLIATDDPVIVGYDQDAWAVRLDYHALPLAPAFAAIAAARTNTTALLAAQPDAIWERAGRHTEFGRFSAEDWLRIYGVHLHDHVAQIEANVAAWHDRSSRS